MIDTTLIFVLTFFAAMLTVALAVTANEFRRMSNFQQRRSLLALQTAPGMSRTRGQTWHSR